MSHRRISLLAATVAAMVVAAPAAAAGWSSPVVVFDGNYSQSSMVVDGHGHAHIAARGDTGIWYLTDRHGSWARTRLTTDHQQQGLPVTASRPAITIDRSNGKLVVAYALTIDHGGDPSCCTETRYVTNNGAGWSAPKPILINPGSDLSVAAHAGDIAIAVLGGQPPGPGTPTLYFASKSGGWSRRGVAGGGENNGTIGSPSLALDSLGRPRIAFQRNGAMKFAVASSPSAHFTIEKVASVSGEVTPSLALDSHDRPMIVWAAASGTFYARRNAGEWYASRVMPGHLEARITIDSQGAHVATADGINGVWYGAGTSSANWTFHHVVDTKVRRLGGIGVGAGRVDIAYERGQESPRVWFTQKGS